MDNKCELSNISNILNSDFLKSLKKWGDENVDLIFDENNLFNIFHTYRFAKVNLNKSDRIFFGEAYKNDSLQFLCKLGYKRLIGMDLSEDIYNQPNYWKIKFYKGDILDSHMPPNFFKAYFSLNTIERLDRYSRKIFNIIGNFFEESSRIIENGGFLILTTRYSDTSIHKKGFNIFNLEEINKILKIASVHGFALISKLDLSIFDKPLAHKKLQFTNIFIVFKLHKTVMSIPVKKINIISPVKWQDGITIYAENLRKRFEKYGIDAKLVSDYNDRDKSCLTIFEYEPGLYPDLSMDDDVFIEAHSTDVRLIRVLYMLIIKRSIRKAIHLYRQRLFLKNHSRILVRSKDVVDKFFPGLKNYYIVPHISYPDYNIRANPKKLCIGSFGFALPFKNFDKICELSIRLDLPCILVLSVNNLSQESIEVCNMTIERLKEKYGQNKNIIIKQGFFSDKEILEYLSVCSHIIFAQDDTSQTSGSYRFPVQLGIPIISTESYQAKESQVIRVQNLDELDAYKLATINDPINLDDGFDYLLNILNYIGN